jgi:hypothetical protein
MTEWSNKRLHTDALTRAGESPSFGGACRRKVPDTFSVVSGQFQGMADGDLVDLLYGEWSTEANSARDVETPHRLVRAGGEPQPL